MKSNYIFSVRRRTEKEVFTADRAMTDIELDCLSPGIVKEIFWKMVEQMMDIKP